MNIIVETNVLLRAMIFDHDTESPIAQAFLAANDVTTVTLDRAAVEAGLAFLEAGGDFADGIIEFEGRRLGGETFATFDRRAAVIVRERGRDIMLLGEA